MKKPTLFIHCGSGPGINYKPIMEEILESIDRSDVDVDVKIYSVCNFPDEEWALKENHHPSWEFGEFHTVGELKKLCDSSDDFFPVGYIHTRGACHPGVEAVNDHRKYMCYFLLENMKTCIDYINEGYDGVGVDWHEKPQRHFSGNFWWSSSEYIRSLPDLNSDEVPGMPNSPRHKNEFFVGVNNPKVKCLHHSNIDVGQRHIVRYPEENYVSKK